ncbi:MAG: WD40 repeat domain-containing protein [Actinomycetota bacterium]|nr:WD40 repeat domain-containing protein [Actinomycetota bacterium]
MPHRSPITTVDHHLGSTLTVTGGYDGRVVAWQGRHEVWAASFDDLVNDVRIDASGTMVAVAVADNHAFVLDAASGARLDRLGPHGDDVNAVRWSPDGSRLVCVMDHHDTAIRVWHRQADGVWHQNALVGHRSGVFGAAFDPTGRFLASVAEDASALVWDLGSQSVLHRLDHPGDPEALDWSPRGDVIVTGCDDGIARVWSPITGALVHELTDAAAAVRFLRFDQTGERLLAGSYDATMRVYDCDTWQVADEYQQAFQWERSGCFADDHIVVGSFTGEPMTYPAGLYRYELGEDPVLTRGINALSVIHNRRLVGRDDGTVFDLDKSAALTQHDSIVNTVAVSPDGSTVASADYRGTLHLTPTRASSKPVLGQADGGGPINAVVWHPSGERLFSGGYDGVIRQWNTLGQCTAQWLAHRAPIKSLAWSASADLIVAGSSDGSVSAWRAGTEVWRNRTDDLVLVNAVAVADGEGVVVTASRDRRVRRWNVHTGELVETLPDGHLKSVKAIATTDDGSVLITGSYDGTGILWKRSEAGRWSWRPLRHHGKPGVPAVALGADGMVYPAGWDSTVGVWTRDGELTKVL